MDNNTLTMLVIDDEARIRRLVRNALNAEPFEPASIDDTVGFATTTRVIEADTGAKGIDLAAAERPTLIVLDLGLPDMQGIDVCREIRSWSSSAIVVLSARDAETEKTNLLDAGADDYVTKPFSTAELMARIRAQLRRIKRASSTTEAASTVATLGDVVVDLHFRRAQRGGETIHLTPTEWLLLRAFISHPRQTMTHRQLFDAVWGTNAGDAQQYLRVYVGHLRRKIEGDPVRPCFIRTEPGIGYRFDPGGVVP